MDEIGELLAAIADARDAWHRVELLAQEVDDGELVGRADMARCLILDTRDRVHWMLEEAVA